MVYRTEITDAELDFILIINVVERRKALNELLRTNMLNMKQKVMIHLNINIKINDLAHEYLIINHRPNKATYKMIKKKINELKGLKQNLSLEVSVDPFNPCSISNVNSKDEILAAYNLKTGSILF